MLWLCIYLPQLSLEALAPPAEHPAAVIVNQKNKRRIVACNTAAAKAGLSPATELATALALYPQLRILERSAKAELVALKRLAAWAYQWSCRVIWQETPAVDDMGHYAAALWLEIGASRALFGGYSLLIKQLERSLQLLHYTYRLGIAPTLEGALLLARAGKRLLITSQQHLLVLIRELPLAYLALPSAIIHALKRSGIIDIGSLLALPTTAVARRFGPNITLYLEQLCGSAPDLRPAYRLPKYYRERCEFGFAVNNIEALLFPLQRMLHEFCGYLRAADMATQHYTLIFEHEQQLTTRIVVGLAAPSRDAERLRTLAREQLHNLVLTASIYGLCIEAKEFTPPAVRQHNLFSGDEETADELQQVLEKISSRLGQYAVRTLQSVADHCPENAWRFATDLSAHAPVLPACPRPLWLLVEPHRLSAQPNIDTQPERIEGSWWAAPLKRDYYITHSVAGERYWVYFDRGDNHWYLHGYWA